jgi:hypothetical protein
VKCILRMAIAKGFPSSSSGARVRKMPAATSSRKKKVLYLTRSIRPVDSPLSGTPSAFVDNTGDCRRRKPRTTMRHSSKTHDDERLSSRHGILHCKPRYPKLCPDGPDDLARGNAPQNSLEAARRGFADEFRFDDLLRRPDEPDDDEHQAATQAPSEDRQRLNNMSVALSGRFPNKLSCNCTLIRPARCALR